MTYSIREHGDLLEKAAASFIEQYLFNYEAVWKIYIGNTGDANKAQLPNYPFEDKRTAFAENSYTVLESSYIAYRILESNIFSNSIDSFDDYFNFNNAFISFFAHLGRIHDTVIKASNCLRTDRSFETSIHHFYEARNIILHGKKISLEIDELGLPKIPVIKTTLIKGYAWDDRTATWLQGAQMDKVFVEDNAKEYFQEMLLLINGQYAVLENSIREELKSMNTQLVFEYKPTQSMNVQRFIQTASGSNAGNDFDVVAAYNYLSSSSEELKID